MVLPLKRWKSRSSPGFEAGVTASTDQKRTHSHCLLRVSTPKPQASQGRTAARTGFSREESQAGGCRRRRLRPTISVAGWSSPVARQAHNLKVAGSNPAPATTELIPRSPCRQSADPPGSPFVAPSRQAHNLKVAGSNPAPATTELIPRSPCRQSADPPGSPFVAPSRQAHNLKVAGSNPAPATNAIHWRAWRA
jgi:hypothetical protein